MAVQQSGGNWATRIKRLWMFSTASNGATQDVWGFDAVLRESHHSELTVTDNPVETGNVVSDHAYMAPLRLEIEAMVSDVYWGDVDASGNKVPTDGDVWASAAGRGQNAFSLLQGLQASAEPFSVQTGLKLYSNMVVTSLDADQDVSTGNVLRFRAALREVQFVTTQTVTYPPRKDAKTQRQASKKVAAGEKKTEPVTDPAAQQSILKQMMSGDVSGAQGALQSLIGGL